MVFNIKFISATLQFFYYGLQLLKETFEYFGWIPKIETIYIILKTWLEFWKHLQRIGKNKKQIKDRNSVYKFNCQKPKDEYPNILSFSDIYILNKISWRKKSIYISKLWGF